LHIRQGWLRRLVGGVILRSSANTGGSKYGNAYGCSSEPGVSSDCCGTLRVPGYSIYQRAHKPQRIEIAGELLASCMPR
jgi:hypothetical protein